MRQQDDNKNVNYFKQKTSSMEKLLNFLLILFIIIMFILFIHQENKIDNKTAFEIENEKLVKANKHLDSLNAFYKNENLKKDSTIEVLENDDKVLKNKLSLIDNHIKSIKYEKVYHYSDNFGSDQLKRYFADSIR
jgi:hypothetical protein